MNLDTNPTIDQLRELVSKCDDASAHHSLWVKPDGEVQLSPLKPADLAPDRFPQVYPNAQLQFETFLAGKGLVGPTAAENDDWISMLFGSLMNHWQTAKGKPSVFNARRDIAVKFPKKWSWLWDLAHRILMF